MPEFEFEALVVGDRPPFDLAMWINVHREAATMDDARRETRAALVADGLHVSEMEDLGPLE
ncbi:hypothetical protein NCPPB3778_44 [Rathayibacter phage NCPPB3778]|nr:hypothetical protein NCPPB3778_44 [Rathayibacter phage NCPPB3778]